MNEYIINIKNKYGDSLSYDLIEKDEYGLYIKIWHLCLCNSTYFDVNITPVRSSIIKPDNLAISNTISKFIHVDIDINDIGINNILTEANEYDNFINNNKSVVTRTMIDNLMFTLVYDKFYVSFSKCENINAIEANNIIDSIKSNIVSGNNYIDAVYMYESYNYITKTPIKKVIQSKLNTVDISKFVHEYYGFDDVTYCDTIANDLSNKYFSFIDRGENVRYLSLDIYPFNIFMDGL